VPDPADTAERRDELRRILRAIDELPEGEREVTILFYVKDQSQKTVASLLHLPITTVNNRLYAARARLKGELLPVMERILLQHTLPAEFADAVGRIVRVAGPVADGLPATLARLGARPSGTEPLETGIKVVDLLCPVADGGSLGLFGDPRVGKLVLVDELAHNIGNCGSQPVTFTFVKAPDEVDVYTKLLADAGPVPTVVIAAEEASEGALAAARPFLDATVFMSRRLVDEGIYPAVDARQSWSRLLDPAFVGADHWEVAQAVLKALGQVDDPGADGDRARRIQNFLSQPFFVAEAYTKRSGVFVPRQETIAAFAALLRGGYDHLPEDAFLMRGTLPLTAAVVGREALWSLNVDDKASRVRQFRRANAGPLGQTRSPADDRLKVAKLLDLLHDRKVDNLVAAAAVAGGAARPTEDDAQAR
jgi:hypothetical protein